VSCSFTEFEGEGFRRGYRGGRDHASQARPQAPYGARYIMKIIRHDFMHISGWLGMGGFWLGLA
jgi:hypothetical protein